jgi:hypothetical protein
MGKIKINIHHEKIQGKMAVFTAKLQFKTKSFITFDGFKKTCNFGVKTAGFPANFK